MEIEIKIRLESRKDYDAVINEVFLPQKPLAVHHQRNIFFDRIDNSLYVNIRNVLFKLHMYEN